MKRRRNVLKNAKGYRFGRSSKEREAKVTLTKAGVYAFDHRRDKKGDFRRLWQIRIGAGLAAFDFSYSKFIGALKKKNIAINRKMLAELAATEPQAFAKVVESARD